MDIKLSKSATTKNATFAAKICLITSCCKSECCTNILEACMSDINSQIACSIYLQFWDMICVNILAVAVRHCSALESKEIEAFVRHAGMPGPLHWLLLSLYISFDAVFIGPKHSNGMIYCPCDICNVIAIDPFKLTTDPIHICPGLWMEHHTTIQLWRSDSTEQY